MAIENYRVLKGRASNLALDDDADPHIEIRIEAGGDSYRIAVNVRSKVAPHDLLYRKQDPFSHPMLPALAALPEGLTDIRGDRPEFALDYARSGIVAREAMEIAPFQRNGPRNDLRDYLEPLVKAGIAGDDLTFYAFGESWGPETGQIDKYFGFTPGRGIHDIHMNQGSRGEFSSTNGPNQDGALIAHFCAENRWAAIFLAFQSQDWNTDARTGHPRNDAPSPGPGPEPLKPAVSIIAALINPAGKEEGRETVTLLNRTDTTIDLTGWQIADRIDRRQTLSGSLEPGEARRVVLAAGPNAPRLRNKAGEIRLLTADGVVTDIVAYQKHEAAREGWTSVF